MKAVSLPTPRPQPDKAQYPPTELNLFDRLTRAVFRTKYGEQAPPWNKVRRIQRWFDSSAASLPPEEPYIFEYYTPGPGGLLTLRRGVVTNAEAAVPNLPGQFDYPKYVPAPSGAWQPVYDSTGVPTGEKSYLPPDGLSTYAEALALREELHTVEGIGEAIPEPYETVLGGPYAIQFDATEKRRFWNLTIAGNGMSVGHLLKAKHSSGIGAPGHWHLSGTYLGWVSDIPTDVGEQDLRPEVPIPQRKLLANERPIVGNPFSGPMIERTDHVETTQKDDAAAMPGRVNEILKRVILIQNDLAGRG